MPIFFKLVATLKDRTFHTTCNMSSIELMQSDILAEIKQLGSIECGEEAAKHFAFADGYKNLNHGWSRLNNKHITLLS